MKMKKFIGKKISKKEAIEIFGEDIKVDQMIGLENGKNYVFISFGYMSLNNKTNLHASAPGNRFIQEVGFVQTISLKKSKGSIYVAR